MRLRDPFWWWPQGRRGRVLVWATSVASLVVWLGLAVIDKRLMDTTGAGIVDFELARNFSRAHEIWQGWSSTGMIGNAKRSIVLDYPFMVLYGVSLGMAAVGLGRRLAARGVDRLAAWAPLIAWAALAAAAFDAIEDVFLWLQITGGARGRYAFPAFAAASIKFVLLAGVLVYLAGGWLAARRRPPISATP